MLCVESICDALERIEEGECFADSEFGGVDVLGDALPLLGDLSEDWTHVDVVGVAHWRVARFRVGWGGANHFRQKVHMKPRRHWQATCT
ncbi:hypothetical protein AWC11_11365 [Mycobacterium interjectum]|nr:hypothetical protein AWC11_11365 [Mycobacterium interjectum]